MGSTCQSRLLSSPVPLPPTRPRTYLITGSKPETINFVVIGCVSFTAEVGEDVEQPIENEGDAENDVYKPTTFCLTATVNF